MGEQFLKKIKNSDVLKILKYLFATLVKTCVLLSHISQSEQFYDSFFFK